MTTSSIREQLYRQLDALPDDLIEQVVKFTQFVQQKRKDRSLSYTEWDDAQWQAFSLGQLFREDEDRLHWQDLEMLKPVEVCALPGYRLRIRYSNGVSGEVDLSYLVGQGVFAAWKDSRNFEKVRVGPGNQITWSEEIELCADALYMKVAGLQANEVFPNLDKGLLHA